MESSLFSSKAPVPKIHKLSLLALFCMGLLNSLGFSMVLTGAHNLVSDFNQSNMIGTIIASVVSCELLVLIINMTYLLGVANNRRIIMCCIITSLGYGIITYSLSENTKFFSLALTAFAGIGVSTSIGECVNLGMLKEFVPVYLVGYSSGAGSSRLVSVVIWLLIKNNEGNDRFIWAALIGTLLLYFISFRYVKKIIDSGGLGLSRSEDTLFVVNDEFCEIIYSTTGNAHFNMDQLRSIFKYIKYLGLVFAGSYFIEALISIGLADRISLKLQRENKNNMLENNLYDFIQLFYYGGIIIGKSLLTIIKIEKLWIILFFQFLNGIIFCLEVYYTFMEYWTNFILVFWVGILGGLCYANTFYILLKTENIIKYNKEASSNLMLASGTFGILLAAVLILVLDIYLLPL